MPQGNKRHEMPVPVENIGDKSPPTEADIAVARGPEPAPGYTIIQKSEAESGVAAPIRKLINAPMLDLN